ncbi:hypothetical protein NE237_025742 [Protea cynaroides]|uniref:Uncharacterized protein n=1 Tax=Protea cynaroides TaxID=273540 RepID=A0A9Q0H4T1_9MAGN|nr:hypothetical protein NE237_025742 [Protea cynaroides]
MSSEEPLRLVLYMEIKGQGAVPLTRTNENLMGSKLQDKISGVHDNQQILISTAELGSAGFGQGKLKPERGNPLQYRLAPAAKQLKPSQLQRKKNCFGFSEKQ